MQLHNPLFAKANLPIFGQQLKQDVDEYLDIDLYEEHGQGHGKICISLESNMAVTHLKIVERQDSLRTSISMFSLVHVINFKPQ